MTLDPIAVTNLDDIAENIRAAAWWRVPGEPARYACSSAKCATMSLRESLFGERKKSKLIERLPRNVGPLYPWQVVGLPGQKFIGVRDPVDRFGSLWRDKCARRSRAYPLLKGLTPDELMDLIEAYPFGNTHWWPQAFNRIPGAELVRFDQLVERLGYEPRHANRSPAAEAELPVERIRRHYATDCAMWARAC